MRILLDECVPQPFRRQLAGHEVRTIQEMGWAGKKNGPLLRLLNDHNFNVLLTVDQNLPYQQRLADAGIGVIVMVAPTNRLADLIPLAPVVANALTRTQMGQLIEVGS